MQAGAFQPFHVEPVGRTALARSGRRVMLFSLVAGLLALAVVPGQAREAPKGAKETPKAEPEDLGPGPDPEFRLFQLSLLRKNDRVYKLIKDDTPKDLTEAPAYEVVAEHARSCPIEALETRSLPNREYGQLIGPGRVNVLRELLQIKGRLVRLYKLDAAKWIKRNPNSELYEGA